MKVLLLIPTAPPSVSGNATTAARWAAGLAGTEVDLRVVATDGLDAPAVARAVAEANPDLLHVYHAWKVGRLLASDEASAERRRGGVTPPSAAALDVPWVVSIPGTDLSADAEIPERRAFMRGVFDRARVLITPSRAQLDRFAELYPELAPRVRIVPKGVSLETAPYHLRSHAGAAAGDVLFFTPAGIRPVKGIDIALEGMGVAAGRDARIRWAHAGPLLEEPYGRPLLERIAGSPWASALGEIPPPRLAAALRGADVLLNASRAEGISNAILEGMACGLPILASDIPSNREVVEAGVNGLLFRDPADLAEQAVRLAADPELRRRLGEAGRRIAAERFSWEVERDALIRAYQDSMRSGNGDPA